jgi:hypothetical protein
LPHDSEDFRAHVLEVRTRLWEEAGLGVAVAASEEVASLCSGAGLKTDLLLANVKVSDYAGILLPDMDTSYAGIHRPALEMIKEAAARGKPDCTAELTRRLIAAVGR